MPPIRTKSSQKPANQEGKILLALDNIKNNCIKSVYTAAKLYNIFYILRKNICANLYKLTGLEEDLITSPPTVGVNWISNFIEQYNEIQIYFSR
ncbi:hypothetical protein N7450_005502 [Penicillium hetheringtonii]|uniref:Uncharacterized protein n=1 Tax=Penicillium hetheringtonii TaxID=911720 RepID=A0AAD6DIM7_9EURO|nr:hypothetical protein N7450_005502 [Penicillium hetheringtonii]